MSKFISNKKVFIVGDIGLDKNFAYHVGDEAMFEANLERYKKMRNWEVYCSSRSISHKNLNVTEFLDIYITSREMYKNLIHASEILLKKNINNFPDFFKPTVSAIQSCDLIHISGGGNLTTLWKGHIYYRCFIINLAKLFNKKIIVTGQTIGVIEDEFCAVILKNELNKVDFLGVRDLKYSRNKLKEIGITNLVTTMIDDTYTWGSGRLITAKIVKIKSNLLKIGLCFHDWKNDDSIAKIIQTSLQKTIQHNPDKQIELYIIPHYLDNINDLDAGYMAKIVKELKNTTVINYSYHELESHPGCTIAEAVYNRTNEMDIIFTTRYHGLVFALALNIPTIVLNLDNYYTIKNIGFLEFFKDLNISQFFVESLNLNSEDIVCKMQYLIDNRLRIKKLLKKQNLKLKSTINCDMLEAIIKQIF